MQDSMQTIIFALRNIFVVEVNFYLNRKSVALKCYPIRGEKPFTYYTNIRIDPDYWSAHSQKVFDRHKQHKEYNALLDRLAEAAKKFIINSKGNGQVLSYPELKDHLNKITQNKNDAPSFKEFAENWLLSVKDDISPETYRNRKSKMKMIFEIFPNLDFHHFNQLWVKNATNTFKKRYRKNTYTKYFQIIRQILILASEDGYFKATIPKFDISYDESVDKIFLNKEDVALLFKHNYKNTYLRNAVNLWMVMYITGCRYGDLKKALANKYMVINDISYLRFIQGKTSKSVTIPGTDLLEQLKTSTYHITSQKLNEYIKIAAKEVGVLDWQKVSCHTARRSIITNLAIDEMPLKQIMDISGHKTEKELMKYIKYNDLLAAKKIGNSEIYKNIISSLHIA